jgi:hypothetical protein
MKKLKSYIPIAILAIIFLAGILKSFKAEAFMGDKAIRACLCCQDGEAVGNSNDCMSGNGTCVENTCPSPTDKVCGGLCP